MKKTLIIVTLFVMLIALTLTGVKASSATLANDLYAKLAPYGATNTEKVRIERYVADNNVTDAQAATVLAKVDAAIAVMNAEGVTDYRQLSESGKSQIKALAQEAANAVGLTLTFTDGTVQVYSQTGKLIDAQKTGASGKLAYTGNGNTALVVSSIAVIALAAIVVAKKGFAKVGA